MKNNRTIVACLLLLLLFCVRMASASGGEEAAGHHSAQTFLWIAVILIAARFSSIVERFGQPSVLGELLMGVALGNLALIGVDIFEPIKTDAIIPFLSELGVVVLLFQIGLESNLDEMRRVGFRAALVAIIGVVVPFALGVYLIGPLFLPDVSFNGRLFLGATLTATSVGITARVFWDLKKLQTPEAQIVLGAAVIDDVLGLIILAVISALVTSGVMSAGVVGGITAKAVIFLVGAIVLGRLSAPTLGRVFSIIHSGSGMKFTLAISFGLILAYVAQAIELAPIVGAFAAGLVLEPVHFRSFKDPEVLDDIKDSVKQMEPRSKEALQKKIDHHSERHIQELLEPLGFFLVPIFFVVTGMNVKLDTFFDLKILGLSLVITLVAFVGKIVSGLAAGKVNKMIVGFGMVPRGEVGLIFAMIGKSLGVVSDEVFSVIIAMVILTTLFTPPILTFLLKRHG